MRGGEDRPSAFRCARRVVTLTRARSPSTCTMVLERRTWPHTGRLGNERVEDLGD
jgi:hypothetical protein